MNTNKWVNIGPQNYEQTSKLWSKPHICPRYIASPNIGPDTGSRGYFTQLGSAHVEVTRQIEPNLLLSSPFCPKCIINNISTACQRLSNFAQQLYKHCDMAQCVLCSVYLSAQPNKLRTILKVEILVSHWTYICPGLFECAENTFFHIFVVFKL